MNASQLKALHLTFNPESLFFTKNNMAHGGDTMKNYGVRSNVKVMVDYDRQGNFAPHEETAYELFRKQKTSQGFDTSVFFGMDGKLLTGAK